MARVYISSTYQDLRTEREAAWRALRELRHDVRAMEDYVASDARPVERCLADVDWCDLYVGIFAWRYGHVPPSGNPERRSITELEYRRATETGRDRLIFLVDEAAPWPFALTDARTGDNERGARIDALRRELGTAHVCSAFGTAEELARKVTAAVTNALAARTAAAIEDERRERASESERQRQRPGQRVVGTRVMDVGALFRGRVNERLELSRLIAEPGTRMVTVLGRAGIGKTALVAKVLGDIEQGRWPHSDEAIAADGIVYLSTRTAPLTLESLYHHCALMLGGDRERELRRAWREFRGTPQEGAERLLQALDGGFYVILIDHVDGLLGERGTIADAGIRAFLEHVLLASRGARLVLTSRDPVALTPQATRFDRHVVLSQGLPVADGVGFLRDLDPNGSLGLRQLSDEVLGNAVKRLHGVPRALELLASLVQRDTFRSLDEIVGSFFQSSDVLNELVREAFRCLDPDERLAIDALAVLGRPVKKHAVEFMLQAFAPGLAVEGVLTALVHSRMVGFDRAAGLLSLNEIDRDYALAQLADDGERGRRALELRAADYYATLRVPRERWRSRVDFEGQVAECGHRIAANAFAAAAEVLAALDLEFVAWTGVIDEVLTLQRRLDGRITDPRLHAQYVLGLGEIGCFVGSLPRALEHLARAAELARACADSETERRATGWMGEACRRVGRLDDAVRGLHAASKIYEAEDVPLRDNFPLMLSLAYSYQGRWQEGLWWAERLRTLATKFGQATSYGGQADDALALACLVAGRFEDALRHARDAVAQYPSIDARDPIGYVLNVAGMACVKLGRLPEAVEQFVEARRDARSPRLEGFAAFNLARALLAQGHVDGALEAASVAAAVLGRIEASEAPAAEALVAALRARQSNDRAAEARALLDCARASTVSPDLLDPLDLVADAAKLAEQQQLADIGAACRSLELEIARRAVPGER